MTLSTVILSVLGLCVFEVVSSLDNAVVNADVLSTMGAKWRKWFLVWGIFFGVFLVRGLLPWLIVWASNPSLGPVGALTASFSNDPRIAQSIQESAPFLLMGGALFLVLLFFHWFFLEPKNFGLHLERIAHNRGAWFNVLTLLLLVVMVWLGLQRHWKMALAAAVGAGAFFITHSFKEHAARVELRMKDNKDMSDFSKLIYLEVLDATFSIDGVVGAFAFTMSVPIIILGNGLGALVVRELTIKGVDRIRHYAYLKNGAMYSIFFLGVIMLLESFGVHVPYYVAPLITFAVIGFFFFKSKSKSAKI
jgi:hypothetical protein